MFARFKLAQTTVVLQWFVLLVIVKSESTVTEEEKPVAEKLTRAIDKRIPPQIAYFIPDQALNDTLLNYISPYGFNGFSSYHPPTINFSELKNIKNHRRDKNDTDLEVSQQHPHQYVEPAAKNHKYSYKRKSPNAPQNFSYQINFGRADKLREKEPDAPHIDRSQHVSSSSSEASAVKKVKKSKAKTKSKRKQKPKIHIKPHSLNYANTLSDLRERIMFVKQKHKKEFEDSNERQHKQNTDTEAEVQQQLQQHHVYSNEDSSYDEYYDTDDTPVVVKKDHRTKASKTNNHGSSGGGKKYKSSSGNKPRYSSTKLSHAASTMNAENESYGNGNVDNGRLSATRKYPKNHHQHDKYCEHPTSATMTNQLSAESEAAAGAAQQLNEAEMQSDLQDMPETDVNTDFENISEPQKGFEIYLTKVIKHPKTNKARRRMKTSKKKPPRQTAQMPFVPTRILSQVRRISEIKHRPRMYRQPTLREQLLESGGHVVYSEDGYEDSFYNHGKENRDLEYSKSVRAKRSAATDVKNLKGQELIDHLDILIRNISDYLNSSEIIPEKKYPLYNSTNMNIHESPIKYSEYAKPVVDDEISSELYESKTKECEEADEGISDDVDLSNANKQNATEGGSKKRLGKLGDRLECLKSKLFGDDPLDNPLFDEKKIQQPQPDNLFTSALEESEKIETIASVYSDVMDNIKFNSINKHQRIFSDYGISDNFPLESVNRPSVAVRNSKPKNELNTNEKYADYKDKADSSGKPKKQEKPLVFANPYKDPVQLPLMDISQYIPTAKYPPTAGDYPLQTDFQPIIPPYFNGYSSSKEVTSPSTSSTTTTTVKPTTVASTTLPQYGPVRTLPTPPPRYRKGPYRQIIAAASNIHNSIQNSQTSSLLRMPHQNIVLLKDRRPIALVRVISNPTQQQLPRP